MRIVIPILSAIPSFLSLIAKDLKFDSIRLLENLRKFWEKSLLEKIVGLGELNVHGFDEEVDEYSVTALPPHRI